MTVQTYNIKPKIFKTKAKKRKDWLILYDQINGTELVLHIYNNKLIKRLLKQDNIYRAFYLKEVKERVSGRKEHFIAFNTKTRNVLFETDDAKSFKNLVEYFNFNLFDEEHAKNMIFLATKFQKC